MVTLCEVTKSRKWKDILLTRCFRSREELLLVRTLAFLMFKAFYKNLYKKNWRKGEKRKKNLDRSSFSEVVQLFCESGISRCARSTLSPAFEMFTWISITGFWTKHGWGNLKAILLWVELVKVCLQSRLKKHSSRRKYSSLYALVCCNLLSCLP